MVLVAACNSTPDSLPGPLENTPQPSIAPVSSPTPTLTPPPPRQLTICLPGEPDSLFLYGDKSQAARSVREAIYDGPLDQQGYSYEPVLFPELPSMADGGVSFEPVQVMPNDLIADSLGNWTNLKEGVTFFPSGCSNLTCSQTYAGQDPVTIDQMVVRFQLRPNLLWSDGAPLTADDSLYSYEVAQALGTHGRPELVGITQSYRALDASTIEWRGLPGLHDSDYIESFFSPLPRHAWSDLSSSQLFTDTLSTRAPIGWGPYVIENWVSGSELTLTRNANYFRMDEGIPAFDRLVFRFMPDANQALDALQEGSCDILDPAYGFSPVEQDIQALQDSGKAAVVEVPAVAWEHLDFGINSYTVDPQRPPFFQSKEVRQAVAQCIDRQEIAAGPGQMIMDSYVPADHPLYNPAIRQYAFDPTNANALLQAAGWLDTDNDPSTPRLSVGAVGVPDGTSFVVALQTSDDPQQQAIAGLIKTSLAQCGIQVDIASGPAEQVFAPGPSGPVFGRQFSLAQFAWPVALNPACFLYTTRQIPGPYPEFPSGWGGANETGYSSPQFDQVCQTALNSLPGDPEYLASHQQAQAIFAEDLPALPLVLHSSWMLTRPDLCGLEVNPANANVYAYLANINYGEGCEP
jgi:peptide/nickel transport system substrate-binding protein